VYCSSVSIEFQDTNVEYDVTAVAPLILVSGNNLTWCPFYKATQPYCPTASDLANGQKLVLWSAGPDSGVGGHDLVFDAGNGSNNSQVNGVMWDQGGDIDYAANSGGFGFWQAQNITFNGNHYQMVGTGPPITGPPSTSTVTSTITGSTTVPVTIPTSTNLALNQ
jgi:hypothetical protein